MPKKRRFDLVEFILVVVAIVLGGFMAWLFLTEYGI